MSLKAIPIIAGSVTTIGGGLIFYFSNNSKNNTNNPDNSTKQPQQQIPEKQKQVKKYLTEEQKTSGKIFSTITNESFDEDEKFSYGLYECIANQCEHSQSFDTLSFWWEEDKDAIFSCEAVNVSDKLPIFYFENQNVDNVQDLNFSTLKQADISLKNFGKYIVVFGNVNNSNEKKKFSSKCDFYSLNSGSKWNKKEKILRMKTYKDTKSDEYFISEWKRLMPFDERFIPDDYEKTKTNFSQTTNEEIKSK